MAVMSAFSITWHPLASHILSKWICYVPFGAIQCKSIMMKVGFLFKISLSISSDKKVSSLKYSSVPYSCFSELPVCNISAIFFNELIDEMSST